MAKQLLIYETAVPVSAARHGKHSVESGGTYAFSAGVNAVPLMAVEILRSGLTGLAIWWYDHPDVPM